MTTNSKSTKPEAISATEAAAKIDELVAGLDDWRGEQLAIIRTLFREALPDVVEEWKWMGSPTWSRDGVIAVGNAHKDKVKLTFAHGAKLDDPKQVFNNGFGGSSWRAIDLNEGDTLPKTAFKALVRPAARHNAELAAAKAAKKPTGTSRRSPG